VTPRRRQTCFKVSLPLLIVLTLVLVLVLVLVLELQIISRPGATEDEDENENEDEDEDGLARLPERNWRASEGLTRSRGFGIDRRVERETVFLPAGVSRPGPAPIGGPAAKG